MHIVEPGGGGGGTLNIYWHLKRGGGVLGTGTTPKRGVLGTGTTPKRVYLARARVEGVLRTGPVKKTILVTDVAQKGGLGAYLLIIFTFFL